MGTRLPIVDLNTNTVSWAGKATKLPPLQVDLMSILVADFPRISTRDRLIERTWGGNPPNDKTLDVHICKLRKALRPMGWRLVVQWSGWHGRDGGYRLEHAP